MDWNVNWGLIPEMQAQEQVSRLIDELLSKVESKPESEAITTTWLPVVDLSNLKPN